MHYICVGHSKPTSIFLLPKSSPSLALWGACRSIDLFSPLYIMHTRKRKIQRGYLYSYSQNALLKVRRAWGQRRRRRPANRESSQRGTGQAHPGAIQAPFCKGLFGSGRPSHHKTRKETRHHFQTGWLRERCTKTRPPDRRMCSCALATSTSLSRFL